MKSHGVDLPLSLTWDPPGPWNVEIDEFGLGFDSVAVTASVREAARKASRLLRHDWRTGRDPRRVRVMGPDGPV